MAPLSFARVALGGCTLVFGGAGLAFLAAPVTPMVSLAADLGLPGEAGARPGSA